MTKSRLHLIGGPTASGKTALALTLAAQENGMIINADAMQVYAGLPLLTAQPTPEEKSHCPHALFEIFDPSEKSSAGRWVALAQKAIDEAEAEGRSPILVGGTGLYFTALIDGLAAIPPIPPEVHEAAESLYKTLGHDTFREALQALDPESAATLKANDRLRLIRAYEVATHTSRSIKDWQKQKPGRDVLSERFDVRYHLLLPARASLYAACDARFLRMLEEGALDEVRALLARELDPTLPAMKIIGVRELGAFLRGDLSLADATAQAQQATRHYAKRQMTWFRNQWKEKVKETEPGCPPARA